MHNKCPLDSGLYWQSESRKTFPQFCIEMCDELMEKAEATAADHTDIFDEDCTHDVEYADTSLQRGNWQ